MYTFRLGSSVKPEQTINQNTSEDFLRWLSPEDKSGKN